MEGEVPTEIVISARERRSTPGTMYSPSPHGKTARRTAAPDRHDLFLSTGSIAPGLHGRGLLFAVVQLPVGISPSRNFSPAASMERTSSVEPFTRNLTLRPAKANP